MSDAIESGALIYECTLGITGVTDFGVSLDVALSGNPLPPEGVRVDVYVAGTANGPVVKGEVVATDYVYMRPDGRITLHIHGVVTAEDGSTISLYADGVLTPQSDGPNFDLRENLTFFTSAESHTWMNDRQFWGEGEVDLVNQKLVIRVRVA